MLVAGCPSHLPWPLCRIKDTEELIKIQSDPLPAKPARSLNDRHNTIYKTGRKFDRKT